MKLVLSILLTLPCFAYASGTLSNADSAFKTCMLEQIKSGLHAKSVNVLSTSRVENFPNYAESILLVDFESGATLDMYTVLLKTDDARGFQDILLAGRHALGFDSVDYAVVRNDIGKDVIQPDLANCAN